MAPVQSLFSTLLTVCPTLIPSVIALRPLPAFLDHSPWLFSKWHYFSVLRALLSQPRQHLLQSRSSPLDLRHHAPLILVPDWWLRVPTRQTLNCDQYLCRHHTLSHFFIFLLKSANAASGSLAFCKSRKSLWRVLGDHPYQFPVVLTFGSDLQISDWHPCCPQRLHSSTELPCLF